MKSTPTIKKAFDDYATSKDTNKSNFDKDLGQNYELFLSYLEDQALEREVTDLEILKDHLELMHHSYEGFFESENAWEKAKKEETGQAEWSWKDEPEYGSPFYLFFCEDSERHGVHVFCGS